MRAFGGREPAGRAREQRLAEQALEFAQVAAHAGLRGAQAPGGLGERAGVEHRDERTQQIPVVEPRPGAARRHRRSFHSRGVWPCVAVSHVHASACAPGRRSSRRGLGPVPASRRSPRAPASAASAAPGPDPAVGAPPGAARALRRTPAAPATVGACRRRPRWPSGARARRRGRLRAARADRCPRWRATDSRCRSGMRRIDPSPAP